MRFDVLSYLRGKKGLPLSGMDVDSIVSYSLGKKAAQNVGTSAVLGKAILGQAILGRGRKLRKLGTPTIRLLSWEGPDAPIILDTPVIYLSTEDVPVVPDEPEIVKLVAPTIRLEEISEPGDDPAVTKLDAPAIYLEVVAEPEEPEVPDEPEEPEIVKLDAPVIYMETVAEPEVTRKSASGNVINLTDSADAALYSLKVYGKSDQGVTSTGAQLLDMTGAVGGEASGITVTTHDDGSYTVVGTPEAYHVNIWLLGRYIMTTPLFTLQPGSYYVTGAYLYSNDGTNVKEFSNGFTLTEETAITAVRVDAVEIGKVYNDRIYPMLNAGTKALPWEAYTGGVAVPTPDDPNEIMNVENPNVTVYGNNLLKHTAESKTVNGVTFTANSDGSVTANGTATANVFVKIGTIEQLPAGDYIANGCPDGGNTATYFGTIYKVVNGSNSTLATLIGKDVSFSVTEPTEISYMMRIANGTKVSNLTFKPMIRLASIADDSYEIGVQTVSTKKVLRGIKTSDASLATYTDADGQMWCADYVDFERGFYVQKIGSMAVTKDSPFGVGELATSQRVSVNPDRMMDNGANRRTDIMCDSLLVSKDGTLYSCFNYEKRVIMFLGVDNEEDLYAFMADRTIMLYYPLATTILRPLAEAEIAAYKALHTHDPETTIICEGHMEIEYAAKGSSDVDPEEPEVPEEPIEPEEPELPKLDAPVVYIVEGEDITDQFSWHNNGGIQYSNGDITDSSILKYSDPVDVSGAERITLAFMDFTAHNGNAVGYGVVFFDENDAHISGYRFQKGNTEPGKPERTVLTIDVPEGATTMRTSYAMDEETYGAFFAYVVRKPEVEPEDPVVPKLDAPSIYLETKKLDTPEIRMEEF